MSMVEKAKIQRMRDLQNMSDKIKGMEDHLQTTRNDLYQINSDVAHKKEEQDNLGALLRNLDQQIGIF